MKSDRDILQQIFDALCEGLANSDLTVSKTGNCIYLSGEDGRDWALSLFTRLDGQTAPQNEKGPG